MTPGVTYTIVVGAGNGGTASFGGTLVVAVGASVNNNIATGGAGGAGVTGDTKYTGGGGGTGGVGGGGGGEGGCSKDGAAGGNFPVMAARVATVVTVARVRLRRGTARQGSGRAAAVAVGIARVVARVSVGPVQRAA